MSRLLPRDPKYRVDGSIAPEAKGLEIYNRPSNGSFYRAGESIDLGVDFTLPIKVTGRPQLALRVGDRTRYATFESQIDDVIWFSYLVQSGDMEHHGIRGSRDALILSGGSIRGIAGAPAVLDLCAFSMAGEPIVRTDSGIARVDGSILIVPEVSGVEIVGAPSNGTVYGVEEKIEVRVEFDLPIEVTGSPQLALQMVACTRQADYSGRGVSGSSLSFKYRVQPEDAAPDGIAISADALALNGGSIQNTAAGAAILDLGSHAIRHDPKHKVDGTKFEG